ncbi:PF07336 family protein [Burkholderia lata]|uniref:PF07336 family protein n=1 Tax=Burkholderia lata (strain ATCC 17760 / DSM 23089 / LMG 22485 / NCIMB 9086 / R18194 / 383) TaxID=482957 RepID=A0A6P2SP31_BURL3|nr:ABATE domain-containing protein [Burkholderia lata]VWC52530.1 PF07336 family protein [Burkholderia lata]
MLEHTKTQKTPLFVGDNLALDFINTQFGVGPARQECFADNDAVLAWLKLAGVLPDDIDVAPEGLLRLALQLRENARCLLSAAKHGVPAEASAVNQVLRTGRALKELEWDSGSGSFKVVRRRPLENAASFLEPVAQAITDLLTHTPLDLVRQCEAHECTLIFHDTTKSHRRRWCSMALCGNRMKVAAFRSRKKGE